MSDNENENVSEAKLAHAADEFSKSFAAKATARYSGHMALKARFQNGRINNFAFNVEYWQATVPRHVQRMHSDRKFVCALERYKKACRERFDTGFWGEVQIVVSMSDGAVDVIHYVTSQSEK